MKYRLLIAFIFLMLPHASALAQSGGSGSKADPYVIATAADLQWLAGNSGVWGDYFVQNADVSAAGLSSPIGNTTTAFTGGYNGRGYAITGLNLNNSGSGNQGLFGFTNAAEIKNLRVTGATINGASGVGVLIGRADGPTIVTNVFVSGSVNSTATGASDAGGLVGYAVNITATNSGADVTVTAAGRNVGGFVGDARTGTYDRCYALGNVSSTGTRGQVGGFAGLARMNRISDSYARGNVSQGTSTLDQGVGGFIGLLTNNATNNPVVSNNYSTGTSTGGSSARGGFVGTLSGVSITLNNNFFNTATSGTATAVGTGTATGTNPITGIDTATMQTQGTFTTAGWDFDANWFISGSQNGGFPISQWAAAPTGTLTVVAGASDAAANWTLNNGVLKPLQGNPSVSISDIVGVLTTPATVWDADFLTIQAPEDVVFNADLTAALNVAQTAFLKAGRDVILGQNASIAPTGAALNKVLWSDTDGNDAGMIWVRSSAEISTNGGHLWMGGGDGTASWNGLTVGDGFAAGSTVIGTNGALDAASRTNPGDYIHGVLLDQLSTLSTNGGNVRILGNSGSSVPGNPEDYHMLIGVYFGDGTSLSSAAGAIEVEGVANLTNLTALDDGFRYGVLFHGNTSRDLVLSSTSGSISIQGTALDLSSSAALDNMNNAGIALFPRNNTRKIEVRSVSGNIDLIGENQNNELGRSTRGIWLTGNETNVLSESGAITITANSGNDALYPALVLQNNTNIGHLSSGTATGTITVNANTIFSLGSTAFFRSSGELRIEPTTAGTTIGLGGATGTLQLPSSYFSTNFVNGFSLVHIGDNQSGQIQIAGATTYSDNLTLQTASDILTNAGATLTGSAGQNASLVFWADADQNDRGSIFVNESNITTNGGHLWMGGGTASGTAWNGLTVGSRGAYADATHSWTIGGSTSHFKNGISIFKSALSTAAGNMWVSGVAHGGVTGAPAGYNGVYLEQSSLTAESGSIELNANSTGTNNDGSWHYGLLMGTIENNSSTVISTTSGSITIDGQTDFSEQTHGAGVGLYSFNNLNTTVAIRSVSGAIDVTGGLNSTGFDTQYGGIFLFGDGQEQIVSQTGAISLEGTSANANVAGINQWSGNTSSAIGFDGTNAFTGDITFNSDTFINYAGVISATNLNLLGAGVTYDFTNAGNNISRLTANTGTVRYLDGDALTLGDITATGLINIATNSGNLTLEGDISSTSTSDDAIILNAGRSETAGTATGGDIIVSGTPTLTFDAAARAKLFSGSEGGSTGLTSLVGGAANTRYNFDEDDTISPALADNNAYAIYRQAVVNGDITIVSAGGTAEGTDWIHTNGLIQTTSATASINASVIEGYLGTADLRLEAASVTINAPVNSASANTLTLKTTDDIVLRQNHSLTTAGGSLVLWADSDGDETGGVLFDLSTSVSTNNGHVWIGGGSGSTTWNGLTVGDSFAGNLSATAAGNAETYAGINAVGTAVNAGSGDIYMSGKSAQTTYRFGVGMRINGMDFSGGNISMYGIGSVNANTGGDTNRGNWGVGIENTIITATANSHIYIQGSGGGQSAGSNGGGNHGIRMDGNSSVLASGTGNLTLVGTGGGNSGITANTDNDGLRIDGGILRVETGTLLLQGTKGLHSNSEDIDYRNGSAEARDGSSNLASGSIRFEGDVINAASGVHFQNAGTLSFDAATSVDVLGRLTADRLALSGTANYGLQNSANNVGIIAGGDGATLLGNLAYRDADALEIGTVGALNGLFSSGTLLVETESGDLTLSQELNTTSTSDDAIILNAGLASAAGTFTGGDIIVSGTPTLTFGTGARAKLFSGLETNSTGLTALVGGAANTRGGFDEVSDLSAQGLVDDQAYAIYRVASGTGDITIVNAGGSAEGTGWINTNGVITTIAPTVSINASDVLSYLSSADLRMEAVNITLDTDLSPALANPRTLTFKAQANITFNAGSDITVSTNPVNLVIWADADQNDRGSIFVNESNITTNGGHLWMGGGTASGTAWNGLTVGSRGAYADATHSWTIGGSTSHFKNGISIFKSALSTAAGNMWVSGVAHGGVTGAPAGYNGVYLEQSSLTAEAGSIELNANSTGTNNDGSWHYGLLMGTIENNSSTVISTTSGSITINGQTDFSEQTHGAGVGLYSFNNLNTTVAIRSVSGAIDVTGGLNSTGFDNQYGGIFLFGDGQEQIVSQTGAISLEGTSANANVAGINQWSGNTSSAIGFDGTNAFTGDITFNSDTFINYAGVISATNLNLLGAGVTYDFTNAGNNISRLTANTGTVRYLDGDALTLGDITATGLINIATNSGNLTLEGDISSTSTSDDAIILNAGRSEAAGTATGGDIIVSGTPTITAGVGGIRKYFSGTEGNSTGLTALAGNSLFNLDETSDLTGLVSAGNAYAIYRVANNSAPTIATNTGATVAEGGSVTFTTAMLAASDADDAASGLTYTLTSLPSNGRILADEGVELGLNDTFTQADIDNGNVWYEHNGSETISDSFGFSLADGGEDGAAAVTDQTFTITVTAVNSAPTIVTNTGATVAEGGSVTFTTAMLAASDADDAASGLTYTLTSLPSNGRILADEGVELGLNDTFTQADIDNGNVWYEHDGSETLSDSFGFSLADGGEDGAAAVTGQTFTITVTAVNSAPTIATNTGATVAEGGSVTFTTAMLAASDADDAASGLTYTLTTLPSNGRILADEGVELGLNDTFTQADIDNGNVWYEHDGSETLSDSFGFSLADGGEDGAAAVTGQSFAITVSPFNGTPVFPSNKMALVDENSAGVVFDVNATDGDGGAADQNIAYAITGGADQSVFSIDAATGEVSFVTPPDFEQPADADANNVYEVQVRATDQGDLFVEDVIRLTINDLNDEAPVIAADQNFNVSEDALEGAVVGTVAASDADAGSSLSGWAINSGNEAGVFSLDEASGQLRVADASGLDFETTASYTLSLTVSDAENTSAVESVTITITDVNEAPIVASTIADFAVDEDAANTVIDLTTVFADAEQAAADLTFSVVSNSNSDLVNASVDNATDQLTLAYQPDQNGVATIVIRATDGGGLSVEETFEVTVNGINDAPVVANGLTDVAVDEDAAPQVISLAGVFADQDGDALSYSVASNSNENLVTATVNADELSLAFTPDSSGVATIVIRATDSGGLSVEETFEVTVNGVNDVPVMLTQQAIYEVPENTGSTLVQLAASDADPGQALRFFLGQTGDASLFSIDADSGSLRFITPPDFENPSDQDQDNRYVLTAYVSDEVLQDSILLEIIVTDVAEQRAFSIQLTAADSVDENQEWISDVPTLEGDQPSGAVQWSLPSFVETVADNANGPSAANVSTTLGVDNELFAIDAQSGQLTLSAKDFENPADANLDNVYELELEVRDRDGNTARHYMQVVVQNINDTAPLWLSAPTAELFENSRLVDTLRAFDPDQLGLGLSYSIQDTLDGQAFTLTQDSILQFIQAPDYEQQTSYQLVLSVSDGQQQTPLLRTINVLDIDEVTDSDGDGVSDYLETLLLPLAQSLAVEFPDGEAGLQSTISLQLTATESLPAEGRAELFALTLGGSNASLPLSEVIDLGEGSYSATYTPLRAGIDSLQLSFTGTPFAGGPQTASISTTLQIVSQDTLRWEEQELGVSYTISAEGGTAPYSWQIDSAALPEGLVFSASTATLSGTPAETGLFTVPVELTDSIGRFVSDSLLIHVNPAVFSLKASNFPRSMVVGEIVEPIDVLLVNQFDQQAIWTPGISMAVEVSVSNNLIVFASEIISASIFFKHKPDSDAPIYENTDENPANLVEERIVVLDTLLTMENGRAVLENLRLTQSGTNTVFKISIPSMPEVDPLVTEPFTIYPGPPFQLDLVEVEDGLEGIRFPVAPQPSQKSALLAKDTTLRGSRLPILAIILDEFGNPTVVQEGDTPVGLATSSTTGNFFETQTDTEPISSVVIPTNNTASVVFYEDPVSGEPTLDANPTPPEGARQLMPAQEQIQIRNMEALSVQPSLLQAERGELARLEVTLVDADGQRVNAPHPGVELSFNSTSDSGQFYLDEEGTQAVNGLVILPSSNRTLVYYRDTHLGIDTLRFSAPVVPQSRAEVLISIVEGSLDSVLSRVDLSDGVIGQPTALSIELRDSRGFSLSNKQDSLSLSIVGGPNAGSNFGQITQNEEGLYSTFYLPTSAGVDTLQVSYQNRLLTTGLLTSRVSASAPDSLILEYQGVDSLQILTQSNQPVIVRITDANGVPLPNIGVRFSWESQPEGAEGAEIDQAELLTNAEGLAQTFVRLGNRIGDYQLMVQAAGLAPASLNFTAITCQIDDPSDWNQSPCGPFEIAITMPSNQVELGEEIQLNAQLVDQYQNPVTFGGLILEWFVNNSANSIATESTNNSGQQSISYTPAQIGGQQLEFIARAINLDVEGSSETIRVVGAAVAGLRLSLADTLQVGEVSPLFLAELVDENGVPTLAPENIAFRLDIDEALDFELRSGSNPDSLQTAANQRLRFATGQYQQWFRLQQNRAGQKQLQLQQVQGISSLSDFIQPLIFLPGAPSSLEALSVLQIEGPVSSRWTEALSVSVRDRFNNAVPSAEVSWRVVDQPVRAGQLFLGPVSDPAQGQANGLLSPTDAQGQAMVGLLLPDQPGRYSLQAQVDGLAALQWDINALPDRYELRQNYPNPFNPSTLIEFTLPQSQLVRLEVFDIMGRKVATLLDQQVESGIHTINFEATGIASGIYFYQMRTATFTEVKKMTLIK